MRVNVKRLDLSVELPRYAHAGDAALDLAAAEQLVVQPSETKKVRTGIAFEIPEGYVGIVKERSGLAAEHGIHCLAGVIDSGYRGEVQLVVHNLGKEPFAIAKGMRVAQLLIVPAARAELVEAHELSPSVRQENGFGSSGR